MSIRSVVQRIVAERTFRFAIAAPVGLMLAFAFFNLTSVVDQRDAAQAMMLGIVNLDEGVTTPLGSVKLSERIIAGMAARLPLPNRPLEDEAAARRALDEGEISMAIVVPPEFSDLATGGFPVQVRVLKSDHLSIGESQLGAVMVAQFQSSLSLAVAISREASARGVPADFSTSPVSVETVTLHDAGGARALTAPFVMSFPTWLAAFTGAFMLYLSTRRPIYLDSFAGIGLARTLVPALTMGVATFVSVLVVVLVSGLTSEFFALWLYAWYSAVAIAWFYLGLFSVLGFLAVPIGLPLAFYQATAAGALAPPDAAPGWLSWINDVLPVHEILSGYRAIAIGGPEGALPILAVFLFLLAGFGLIWVGTAAHALLWPRNVENKIPFF